MFPNSKGYYIAFLISFGFIFEIYLFFLFFPSSSLLSPLVSSEYDATEYLDLIISSTDLGDLEAKLINHLPSLENVILDDLMTFVVTFMFSPDYVKNPYLRAKLVEVTLFFIFFIYFIKYNIYIYFYIIIFI